MIVDTYKAYNLWFRHSGEELPSEYWHQNQTKNYTTDDIKEKIKSHTITHMSVDKDLPHNIHLLAPELKHFRVKQVQSDSTLQEQVS